MISPQQVTLPTNGADADDDEINFAEYFDILLDNRWLILLVTALVLLIGSAYAILARPIFESNLMIQVEDSEKSAGSFLGDAATSLFDVKTPAAGEIEIIRSRMILGQAVENTKLYIDATPRYLPLIGKWLAGRATELSEPGFLGIGGRVSGTESIVVPQFEVPATMDGAQFTLTVLSPTKYTLTNPTIEPKVGTVGAPLEFNVDGGGKVYLLVSELNGRPNAEFRVVRRSKQQVLNSLQDELKVAEKGKQSGVIDVSWQSPDPDKLTRLLNEIGVLYIRQNVDRKAAEAEKTLGFLNTQLPEFKRQLERSEDVYNRYRNINGTISLDDEAKNALTQIVDLQSKILEIQQKRRDLITRFTEKHPSVQALDAQINAFNAEIAKVNSGIKKMPLMQQDTVRMQRDIKVNTDLYVSLLNSSLQMNLAKEGKVGNARLLDEAIVPEQAIKPKKSLIIAVSAVLGMILGAVLAVGKSMFFGGIKSAQEVEQHTNLNVYSTIPLSGRQVEIDKDITRKTKGIHLLSALQTDDPAVESLRSLRTALQFAMLDASNNRLIISGATPGVGKSFVSANFAAIIAATGKKVLLIDADLRKGRINQIFSLPRANGLSELIVGSISLEQAVTRAVVPNLDLISTGMLPPNPAELLMSESFAQNLDKLSPKYDLVIIDTAPVLVAADTASVAPLAATLLLVARAEKTHLGELSESAKRLSHAGSTVTGVIINALDTTRRHYGSYGYKYGGYRYTQYKYQSDTND